MIPLTPGDFFHVYNRGNNRENLFREAENYRFFLRRYLQYIEPVAATYAYCLLPNHFHLLIRVHEDTAPGAASRAFSNLFNSYSKAVNRRYGRTGSLFEKRFHRKRVERHEYALALVRYIHRNPERHGLVRAFREWPWSSYHALTSPAPTPLQRDALLAWYDDDLALFIADQAL